MNRNVKGCVLLSDHDYTSSSVPFIFWLTNSQRKLRDIFLYRTGLDYWVSFQQDRLCPSDSFFLFMWSYSGMDLLQGLAQLTGQSVEDVAKYFATSDSDSPCAIVDTADEQAAAPST